MESIERSKCGRPDDCMLDLLGRWTSSQAGTGTLPHTWQTVVEAVKATRFGAIAENVAHKHGLTLVTVTACHLATVSYTADDIVSCSCHHCAVRDASWFPHS